ncbi:beta-propeller fold lactonase family protein [Paeniglutamicibacter antarcticus]|uniref:Beta-propeller fold lactonase family protein n=1 Tax=Arthrobacter terrae TaxID=2935737 RepID=A0A931CP63_9MICC|nr:beta-propeller fold lactonase family protein [Arthrobacter terrae]MBG0738436.1 beta-propeller fold lactonase family protein [Arthrobacter terrae]
MKRTLWVGSYTEPGSGTGVGISAVVLDDAGLPVRVRQVSSGVRNPSFLAVAAPTPGDSASPDSASPDDVIYAVEEQQAGTVVSLNRADLSLRSRTSSGGSDPCDLTVRGGHLLVANYSSGMVAVIPVRDGALSPLTSLAENTGSGPDSDRQRSPHAHQVTLTQRETVLVCDLGTDRVDEYSLAPTGTLTLLCSAQLPAGAGPRHLVHRVSEAGEDLLVAGELDARLHRFRRSADGWIWASDVALAARGTETQAAPSALHLSDDGGNLYVAVRGPDVIVVLEVPAISTDADPRVLARVPSGGQWPRHIVLDGPRLYVANERSHRISVLSIGTDGIPNPEPVRQFAVNSPTCLVLT